MTRGKLVLVTNANGDCLVSPELNGDMYCEGRSPGMKAFKRLQNCNDEDQFAKITETFLSEYRYLDEYKEEKIKNRKYLRYSNVVLNNFESTNYFKNWFSDFLYIRNISGSDIDVKDYNGNTITLKNRQVTVLNFGNLCTIDASEDDEELN